MQEEVVVREHTAEDEEVPVTTQPVAEADEDDNDETMDVTEIVTGSFYKKDMIEPGDEREHEITGIDWTDFVNKDGEPERPMPQLTLDDEIKWSLNVGNTKIAAKYFGKDTRRWVGRQIVVFHDEGVMFAGSVVGGLRLRVPKSERGR